MLQCKLTVKNMHMQQHYITRFTNFTEATKVICRKMNDALHY